MRCFILLLVAFTLEASAECVCKTMKWASCDGIPCSCSLTLGENVQKTLECNKLVSKCYLMKAEMYRLQKGLTRSGGKPTEHAIVDNDGIYDPVCEETGKFKAVQCNNTAECWCVNSAGVRRSDKGTKEIKCDELVETYWVRFDLTHKQLSAPLETAKIRTGIENAFLERYQLAKELVKEVEYDKDLSLIVVDVKKAIGDRVVDLSRIAYYLEKDVKGPSLFQNTTNFEVSVEGQKVAFKNIIVYYVDEKPPTFTMKKLTGGVIAVIVVVTLVVAIGLLSLYLLRRRELAMYNKTQAKEMDDVQRT